MPDLPDHPPTQADKLAVYDRYADSYRERTWGFSRFLAPEYEEFVSRLPGPRVLDLGSGPGRDALELKRRGLEPVALDLSSRMLELCARQGLETLQMDIESLSLPRGSFDGVWSYTSLTTIPKASVFAALGRVRDALVPSGALLLGLIEGEGEGWKPANEKYDVPRYVSRYRLEEVCAELEPAFELVYYRRLERERTGRNTYLNLIFRRR